MKGALLIAAVTAAAAAAAAGFVLASHAASANVPGCRSHAPNRVPKSATAAHFVRPGASAMRLCRYNGGNSANPLGLEQQRLIGDAVTIRRITRMFNGLRAVRGIYHCPMDDGSELLVMFGYPNGTAERVAVSLTGCRFAWNGRSSRWMTPPLRRRLLNLVKG